MLKKFKILTAIILFSLFGIVGIMGVWLLDNYRYRRELVIADIDRSLFNTIQHYYDAHEPEIKDKRNSHFQEMGSKLSKGLSKRNYFVDSTVLVEVWDSIADERFDEKAKNRDRKSYRNANAIMPSYMLQNLRFDDSTLAELSDLLVENLKLKGLDIGVELESKIIEGRPFRRGGVNIDEKGFMTSRPVMVNPSESQFIVAKFKEPVLYILGKMFLQIILAILIFGALLGGFFYLLWTINKQNKMALLRKSFVNNMTHELKTPVATVMAAIEAIQRYSAKDDKEKTAKYLQISNRELNHLAGMIDKVLRLDVDETEGVVIQKDNVVINTLLTECLEVAKLSSEKPIKVNVNLPHEPLMIQGDYGHLKNVFNNLLDNAIKYSKEIVDLDIQAYEEGQNVIVSISDKGLGIDSIYQKDIFDMFFRVPNGNLHPVKGFGLGLPYVKQIIEKHGGQVKVESKLDKGSCFSILIPKS